MKMRSRRDVRSGQRPTEAFGPKNLQGKSERKRIAFDFALAEVVRQPVMHCGGGGERKKAERQSIMDRTTGNRGQSRKGMASRSDGGLCRIMRCSSVHRKKRTQNNVQRCVLESASQTIDLSIL